MENTISYILTGVCGVGCLTRLGLTMYYKRAICALKSMKKSKNKTALALREQFILRYQAMLGVENVDFFVGRFLAERKFLGISLTSWNGVHSQFVSACLLLGTVSAFALVVKDAEVQSVLTAMFHGIWTSALLLFVDGFCMVNGKINMLHDSLCDYLENYLKVRLEHEYKIWGKYDEAAKPTQSVLDAQLRVADEREYFRTKKQELKKQRISERKNSRQAEYAAKVEEKVRKQQEKMQQREQRMLKRLEKKPPVYQAGRGTEGAARVRQETELLKREVEERRRREAEAAAAKEQLAEMSRAPETEPQENEQREVDEMLKEFLVRC